jgi:hypothetical protein
MARFLIVNQCLLFPDCPGLCYRASIILVWALGAKIDFRRSKGGVGVDIFSVLDLRVSTWVTYSPQDSVQRLLLKGQTIRDSDTCGTRKQKSRMTSSVSFAVRGPSDDDDNTVGRYPLLFLLVFSNPLFYHTHHNTPKGTFPNALPSSKYKLLLTTRCSLSKNFRQLKLVV